MNRPIFLLGLYFELLAARASFNDEIYALGSFFAHFAEEEMLRRVFVKGESDG